MKPEPFAWAYQNANTEHQYLVWHKQEGGRNWMPLFTLTDVQEAIRAEREACALVCETEAENPSCLWEEPGCWKHAAENCAGGIRARKENT